MLSRVLSKIIEEVTEEKQSDNASNPHLTQVFDSQVTDFDKKFDQEY